MPSSGSGASREAAEAVRDGLALDPAGQGTVYLSIAAARLAAIRGDAAEAARRLGELDLDALDPDVAAYAAAVGAEARSWASDPAGRAGDGGGRASARSRASTTCCGRRRSWRSGCGRWRTMAEAARSSAGRRRAPARRRPRGSSRERLEWPSRAR